MERRADLQNQTPRVLAEFLEVAITSIVFLKGIYPPDNSRKGATQGIAQYFGSISPESRNDDFGGHSSGGAFERRRYMNIVVQCARYPQLRDYIHSAVTGLLPFIQKGSVERITVIFYNKDHVPAERFVFKLALNELYDSKVEEQDLEFALRSFLVKLSVAQPPTKTLPQDCKWEITAYFRNLPVGNKEAQLWIPTETKQWQQPPLITPIKSMSSEPLSLQLYIERPTHSEPSIPSNNTNG